MQSGVFSGRVTRLTYDRISQKIVEPPPRSAVLTEDGLSVTLMIHRPPYTTSQGQLSSTSDIYPGEKGSTTPGALKM